MILKSFQIKNIDIEKNNFYLFYGDNKGAKSDAINFIVKKFSPNCLKYDEEEILINKDSFLEEIFNKSLFEPLKSIVISRISEKILPIIQEIYERNIIDTKIIINADLLEKKSKLRNFFEKEKKTDIVPCYQDNEITLKNIISKNLKDYSGLTTAIINLIIDSCGNSRTKIKNEIIKIKAFFNGSSLNYESISKLLNIKENEDFNFVRDFAISGNKKKTGEYLDNTILETEKTTYYLSNINQRLMKLKEVVKNKKNIEQTINEIRPPIFWKDKSTFLLQARVWNIKKLDEALKKIYNTEIRLKSNADINKNIVLKNLIVDICNLATAS